MKLLPSCDTNDVTLWIVRLPFKVPRSYWLTVYIMLVSFYKQQQQQQQQTQKTKTLKECIPEFDVLCSDKL